MNRISVGFLACLLSLPAAAEDDIATDRGLLRALAELETRDYTRPVHALPVLPGTFESRATAPLKVLGVLFRANGRQYTWPEDAKAVLRGDAAVSDLSDGWRDYLAKTRAPVQEVLAGTHSASGKTPLTWQLFGALSSDSPDPVLAYEVVRLSALEARRLLVLGEPKPAVAICGDALALLRDASYGPLIMRFFGGSAIHVLLEPCLAAARSCDDSCARSFEEQLRLLQGQWGTDAWTLRQELIFGQLFGFSYDLEAETMSALSASARQLLADGQRARWEPSGVVDKVRTFLVGGWSRRSHARGMQLLIKSVGLSGEAAEKAFEEGMAELDFGNLLVSTGEPSSDWRDLVRRLRRDRNLLDLLSAALAVDGFERRTSHVPATLEQTGFIPWSAEHAPRWIAETRTLEVTAYVNDSPIRRLVVPPR